MRNFIWLSSLLSLFCLQPIVADETLPVDSVRIRVDNNMKDKLVQSACEARQKAYAPYSEYRVGAALLTGNGQIFKGSNIENASYGLTCCAERVAVFKAVSEGENDFAAIAVVTKDGGSPCGACRQVLNEFNPDMVVLIGNESGKLLRETTLRTLLPYAFGPQNLD